MSCSSGNEHRALPRNVGLGPDRLDGDNHPVLNRAGAVANFSAPSGISPSDMHLSQPELAAVGPPLRVIPGRCDARIIADSLLDPATFAELFDRYWAELHAFCTSRTGAAGEDIAAETFRLAFDRRDRYDQRYEDARPWLYAIAGNLLRHHFRTAQRRGRAEGRSAVLAERPSEDEPIGSLERQWLGPQLTAALGELAQADRDALLLFAWADLDYAEIARAMEIPVGTVRSRIHRARARVRAYLTEGNRDD
jgi:RNA polymerase sigma factor (sigma-70 family)